MTTLILLLSACSASIEGTTEDDGAFVLTTYDVPVGYESRTVDVLNRAFYRGENVPSGGRAIEGNAGSLIVSAPANTQDDVAGVIERLAKVDPKVAEPQNVRLSYWMVGGKKAAAVDTTALPTEITAAMTEVAGTEPAMQYEVLFHESLLSLDGSPGKGSGDTYSIEQLASLTPSGSILADIDITVRGGAGTETRVQLVPGQVLVMGQTAGRGDPHEEKPLLDALFYVVRPERVPAQ